MCLVGVDVVLLLLARQGYECQPHKNSGGQDRGVYKDYMCVRCVHVTESVCCTLC